MILCLNKMTTAEARRALTAALSAPLTAVLTAALTAVLTAALTAVLMAVLTVVRLVPTPTGEQSPWPHTQRQRDENSLKLTAATHLFAPGRISNHPNPQCNGRGQCFLLS